MRSIGLGVVWVLGAMALQLPGQTQLRRAVQRSVVLQRLNSIVPPRTLLNALGRIDPFPRLAGPPVPTTPPDPRVLSQPGVRRRGTERRAVLGTACGLGVEGSGWVARPGVVVTAAHVVAGEDDTTVSSHGRHASGRAVAFDPQNDVAMLRVPGLDARGLSASSILAPDTPVAIVGYPENGPLAAVPGRIGTTATVFSRRRVRQRPVSRARSRASAEPCAHGDSGGPAVDASGAVQATVFAARLSGPGGYGVPASIVRRDLASARGPVSTGPCAR